MQLCRYFSQQSILHPGSRIYLLPGSSKKVPARIDPLLAAVIHLRLNFQPYGKIRFLDS